jgi:hypothetical protein
MMGLLWLALIFLNLVHTKAVPDENMMRWYNRIFGTSLLNTFADSETLELAVNETITKVQQRAELGIMGFQCSSYTDGAFQGNLFKLFNFVIKN